MEKILKDLSDFDGAVRRKALTEVKAAVDSGALKPDEVPKPWLNLHLHTFHSFNYRNWSPARIVLEGWKIGLKYVGTVDFDSLAGLEETLEAGRLLNVAVTGGFESRVFLERYKDTVINSPKEPGIYYLCGKFFKAEPPADSNAGQFFLRLKEIAQSRNKMVIARLNDFLGEVQTGYEKDVLPLTPSANPTERHIILAYQLKSEAVLGPKVDSFWAEVLGLPEARVRDLRTGKPEDFQERLRGMLVKYGGPGYVAPEPAYFPGFDEVVAATVEAGGVPVGTWLDGTSPAEQESEALMGFLHSKGIQAVTIIPERNWNIADPEEKAQKMQNLEQFMEVCQNMDMPVVCGTEMNKFGQPFVDDFNQPILSRYLPYFLQSAERFMKR